jgi:hypothetical protein
LSNYYPAEPFRRFWFLRGRLAVADSVSVTPHEANEVFDAALYMEHMRKAEEAGEAAPHEHDQGVKGFLYGQEPNLIATIRWQAGSADDAKHSHIGVLSTVSTSASISPSSSQPFSGHL